jgi:hypothetical protein
MERVITARNADKLIDTCIKAKTNWKLLQVVSVSRNVLGPTQWQKSIQYLAQNDLDTAFEQYADMKSKFRPRLSLGLFLLRKAFESGKHIYQELMRRDCIKYGMDKNLKYYETLLEFDQGKVAIFKRAVESLQKRDTILLFPFAINQMSHQDGVRLYESYKNHIEMDSACKTALITLCGRFGDYERVRQLIDQVKSETLGVVDKNIILTWLLKLKDFDSAVQYFNNIKANNFEAYRIMIDFFCHLGQLSAAVTHFDAVPIKERSISMITQICHAIINAKELETAHKFVDKCLTDGQIKPDTHLITCLYQGYWFENIWRYQETHNNIALQELLKDGHIQDKTMIYNCAIRFHATEYHKCDANLQAIHYSECESIFVSALYSQITLETIACMKQMYISLRETEKILALDKMINST